MTLSKALHKIFTENRDKYYTAAQLKDAVKDLIFHYPKKGEWELEFMSIRQKLGICKIYMIAEWHYILTDRVTIHNRHNKTINKEIQTLETRKV